MDTGICRSGDNGYRRGKLMSFLVRKISKAKWPDSSDISVDDFPADSIADLRTTGNTLSFWEIDSYKKIDDVVLALAVATNIVKIEKMDLVLIPKDKLEGNFIISCEAGKTAAFNLADAHRNLCNLTYKSLGYLAGIIGKGIRNEKTCIFFSKKNVKNIVFKALEDNQIDEAKCSDELKNELTKLRLGAGS